jgi:Tol biopolymer transport system component
VVQGRGPDGQQGLHVVNVETGAVTTIVSRTAADDSRRSLAAPSPDGRRVFFRSAAAASATDAGGIGMLTLASGAAQNVASQAVRVFALSPDGQWLALTGSEPRDGPIAIIPSAGGASRPMAPVLNSWSVLGPIAWSSDGRFVFVVKFVVKSGVAVREVWQVPFDGTEPRDTGIRLPGDVSRISAHPDGRRLAISMEVASAETWVLQNIPPVRGEK